MAIRSQDSAQMDQNEPNEIFHNPNYLNQLSELMENIADKGATIAQLKDGTVFVSETRIVVYKYLWDSEKCIFVKQRTRNARNNAKIRAAGLVASEIEESEIED